MPPPLRVVFLAHSFPRHPGDLAGSFLLRLARALETADTQVHVVAPGGAGLAASELVDGVPVTRYRYAPRAHETLAYTGAMAEAVRGSWAARAALGGLLAASAVATRRVARRWRADLVHAHWWFPGGAAVAPSLFRAARPLVLTLHGSDVRLARKLGAARRAYASVAARAAVVTAVSSYLCAESSAMAPGLACEVAPMPVDDALFSPPLGAHGRRGVLFVGRLTRQKGADALLRASASFQGPLTVCGSGPEEPALRALAESLGVAQRVRWLPTQPQPALAALYREAAVVVVPSYEEGLGLVAVEAALSGAPVVGFRSGGLVDVVESGGTGTLVPPGDLVALGRAIERLLTDPALAAAMGERGRRAAARFGAVAAAARYRDVYARALGGAPAVIP